MMQCKHCFICSFPNSLQITYLKDGSTRHLYVYHESGETITNWYMAVRCAKLHRLQVAYPAASDNELVDHLTEDFAKEGWLWKSGLRISSYKKRWFTLENRKFMYHDDVLDAYPKGEIFIGKSCVITLSMNPCLSLNIKCTLYQILLI